MILRVAMWSAALLFAAVCHAQSPTTSISAYPTQPVRLIVPYAAGGTTDVIARVVAQKLSDNLGQQFFVENLPGAGGKTAIGKVAKMPANDRTHDVDSTAFVDI